MRDVNSTSTDGSSAVTGPDAADAAEAEVTDAAEPGSVHVIRTADRVRLVLTGEVDADLGPDLAQAGADAEHSRLPIEVDAHHVTFMDSSGVAFLAGLAQRTEHRIRLINVPPTVRFLLEITRIGELLDVVDDAGA